MGVVEVRKIIHIDMDAFFASVEQRDFPEYRGKPVIVGGDPASRGVVSTCSYEARKYGIHSAMPTSRAYRLCPHGIFLHPRFEAYKAVSIQIRDIFQRFTDRVEPLSLDEAYLDVTHSDSGFFTATDIAKEIKRLILEETRLTASAGVASTKFVAKVASGFRKPDGLTVIRPEKAEAFIEALPIGAFYGIGEATEKKMVALGIHNGKELKTWAEVDLVRHFGKSGRFYYNIARGIDPRPVENHHVRKSVGAENTFAENLIDLDSMRTELLSIAETVSRRLKKIPTSGKTITLKVRYADFEIATRSVSLPAMVNDVETLYQTAASALPLTDAGVKEVRLLGISVSNLDLAREEAGSGSSQLELGF